MNYKDFLSGGNWIMYNTALASRLGGHEFSLMLSYLLKKSSDFKDDWFYLTKEKIKEELIVGFDLIERTVEHLESIGVIYTKREGIPYKRFFKIADDADNILSGESDLVYKSKHGGKREKGSSAKMALQGNSSSENPIDAKMALQSIPRWHDSDNQDGITINKESTLESINKESNVEIESQKPITTNISPPIIPPKRKPGTPTPEIIQVIQVWNEITGQSLKPSTRSHHELINKRIEEGYTVEDFKTVIQAKYDEWKDNPDMFIYIRPSTILNGHFEGYFNVAKMPKPKKTNDVQKFRTEAEAYENEYPEIHAQYITYLSYTTENFKNLLKSDCKILTFLEYYKYRTKTIYPAMNLVSTSTAKDLMMESHKDLNLDVGKGNSVFDYFTKKIKEC